MTGAKASGQGLRRSLAFVVTLAMLVAFFGVLVWGYLATGPDDEGLALRIDGALVDSGVTSRVTAVLLNFRAYDTLLECFVLFLGVVAVWSLRPYRSGRYDPPVAPILSSLVRLLVPLMVLAAGYLLWAGSNQAGGAFQAGAVLGGAGVLLLLTSSSLLATLPRSLLSWGLSLGPLFFLAIALGAVALGGNFLEYRRQWAALIIPALEAVAALSIGLSLAALFGGRQPGKRRKSLAESAPSPGEEQP